MLRRFKLRLLGVIVIVTVVGLIMQSGQVSRRLMEPILVYVMHNKYDVGAIVYRYVNLPGANDLSDILPASGGMVLRQPCEFLEIERDYGWYWDKQEKKQKFSSGIHLIVKDETAVNPIIGGQVAEITQTPEEGTVLIRHDSNFYSLYGGLKQILVEQGDNVEEGDSLGTTGTNLYLEVRGKDGPVNPQSIFK